MDASRRRIVVMGAAGRDFHNFLCLYADDPGVEVVCFTATQIPGIAGRRFPPSLAGSRYPNGIPIVDQQFLPELLRRHAIDEVVFSYSDVAHDVVMHEASRVLAGGAAFTLPSPARTMLPAARPVIAVSAVRTGCGKSQVSRWLVSLLREQGLNPAVIRHPMPYGELEAQRVQRFASREDLLSEHCTLEEREEYEPHIERGAVVFAGVDYRGIIAAAEREGDVIVWDGGNNDFPFLRPDLHIVLVDAMRPGHERHYHPGEAVLRSADVVLVAKSEHAGARELAAISASIAELNPAATIVRGTSPVRLDPHTDLRGKRVLVIEDGPTLTHGGMPHGAGYQAVRSAGATIVDPRPYAGPELTAAFAAYPHIGPVLPALGYYPTQLEELAATIGRAEVDAVVTGTPIDLGALIGTRKPVIRARYDYADGATGGLRKAVLAFLAGPGCQGTQPRPAT